MTDVFALTDQQPKVVAAQVQQSADLPLEGHASKENILIVIKHHRAAVFV